MSQKIFDRALAMQRAANKADLVHDLMHMLVADLGHQKTLLGQCWNSNDRTGLREVVHKIHGGTRYCGVPALQQASEALETAIDNHETDLSTYYANLLEQIDRLINADLIQLLATN